MTAAELEKLLADATPGEWSLHGPVYNRTVGADDVNRICFLAHGNGLNDDRDIANARLVAAAPTLARRAIAAEKLAEALREIASGIYPYAEGCENVARAALAAYEATQ